MTDQLTRGFPWGMMSFSVGDSQRQYVEIFSLGLLNFYKEEHSLSKPTASLMGVGGDHMPGCRGRG